MIRSKPLLTTALLLGGTGIAVAQTMPSTQPGLVKAGSIAPKPGSTQYFTGKVTVAELVRPMAPGRAGTGLVAFQAGARSNWHTHPAGQTLFVTAGCGWTQREGGPVQRICKGDTVYVPAGVRHWHGATNKTAMTHLSITETIGGRNVDWMEPVSPEQFRGPTS